MVAGDRKQATGWIPGLDSIFPCRLFPGRHMAHVGIWVVPIPKAHISLGNRLSSCAPLLGAFLASSGSEYLESFQRPRRNTCQKTFGKAKRLQPPRSSEPSSFSELVAQVFKLHNKHGVIHWPRQLTQCNASTLPSQRFKHTLLGHLRPWNPTWLGLSPKTVHCGTAIKRLDHWLRISGFLVKSRSRGFPGSAASVDMRSTNFEFIQRLGY